MRGPMRHHRIGAAAITAVLHFSAALVYASDGTSLAAAVKAQDRATVASLLNRKAPVDVPLPDGTTALHWAVQWQQADLVNTLLNAGAPVHAIDEYGVMPLWLAAINGSTGIIQRLLRAGADPNASIPTGETVLMVAARTGIPEAVAALLERGAHVNHVVTATGQTALMWAAAEGHVDVVRALLRREADVRARSKSGYTALLLAARNPGLEIPTLLLSAGAGVNEAAVDGTTALVVATIRSNTALAKFLIEQGADVNRGPGFTPLHWAAGYFGNTGVNGRMGLRDEDSEWARIEGLEGRAKLDFVKLLLDHGADVNARADVAPRAERGDMGRSVINASLGTREAVKFGATPFWLAARVADVDIMRLLLQRGADASIRTGRNVTPLMAAAGVGAGAGSTGIPEAKAVEAVRLCVESGNDINVANIDGETALHGASYRTPQPADNLIRFLVVNGANMNVKNKRGWTPLAIVEGLYFNGSYTLSKSAAALLLSMGADPTPEGSVDRQVATLNVGVVNR